jgi:N-dimethylarginine dimethylaminohydrolase
VTTTAQSETGALRKVLLKHPRWAFEGPQRIEEQWSELNYQAAPDFGRAVEEFEAFAEILRDAGAEVVLVEDGGETTLDSIYVRDAAVVTDAGAISCAMSKAARADEPLALQTALDAAGIETVGAITGEGRLEGGDVCWLPGNRLAVGRGYRSNDEGIRQLAELTRDLVEEIVVVPLPHGRGPADVFHLMSILSPVAADAVLVYSPLLPVPFREWLLHRGLRLVEVAEQEFASMACNVLALADGKCLMLDGNPLTRARLEAFGIEVAAYAGAEIYRKGEGGPTCLTRPLVREK